MDYADSPFQIKSLNDSGHIEGLLAGFGNVDRHGDRIQLGAFTKTLAARGDTPLPMLLHHDQSRPIGAWREWQERGDGLYVKGSLTLATRDAQEAHALAKDGALGGLSIGYRSKVAAQGREANELIEVDLFEGSLVAVPCNPNTRVTSIKTIGSAKDIADLLRETGVSGHKAKAAAGLAWKAINDTDDDAQAEADLRAIIGASIARLTA